MMLGAGFCFQSSWKPPEGMLLVPLGGILAHSGVGKLWIGSWYCDSLSHRRHEGVGTGLLAGSPCRDAQAAQEQLLTSLFALPVLLEASESPCRRASSLLPFLK